VVAQICKECYNIGYAIKKATEDCIMPKEGIFARVIIGVPDMSRYPMPNLHFSIYNACYIFTVAGFAENLRLLVDIYIKKPLPIQERASSNFIL